MAKEQNKEYTFRIQERDKIRWQKLQEIEDQAKDQGFSFIAGLDEAGRGPLAGPVVVAACILNTKPIFGLNDSKKISELRREYLYDLIKAEALAYKIIAIEAAEIDKIGINPAIMKAAQLAVRGLTPKPDLLLADALTIETEICPCQAYIKGDAKINCIAAASILAKVYRDRLMREFDKKYPEYGFAEHKGYGTQKHLEALENYGITAIHRRYYLRKWQERQPLK